MICKVLGKSNVSVPPIIVGYWQVSGWSSSNDQSMLRVFDRAIELGLTAFDTAPAYGAGHSEKLLSKALYGKRDKVVLLTKFSHKDVTPQRIRESLENSLRRLNTDYIDVFQQHWPSRNPILHSILDELVALRDEGKIRAIGVCNWLEPEWSEIGDRVEVDVLQACYNLAWRDIDRGVVDICSTKNISIICSSPLCQGILAGRFKSNESLPPDPRRQNWWMQEERFSALYPLLEELELLASKHKASMSQISLAWLLAKSHVCSIITGQTSEDQLIANAAALEIDLSEAELASLDSLSKGFLDHDPHESLWGWHSRRGL